MLRIHVVIATVGRPDLLRRTVDLLSLQVRPPDGVLIVVPSEADAGSVRESPVSPEVAFSPKGLCRQRNRALDLLAGRTDVILFLDDDFIMAPGYIAALEDMMSADPGIAGLTGELVGDGVCNGGYSVEQALAMIDQGAAQVDTGVRQREALYGCNMAIRLSAATGLRFDEVLPLYGWQEDIDFTHQLSRRGRTLSTGRLTGVHLGVKGGRTSGVKLGYSQVANVVYLLRKGTMPPKLGRKLLFRNLASNLLRAPFPEPHIDRAGRLAGNLRAMADMAIGRMDPRKIERM